jgi:hypothetical protein
MKSPAEIIAAQLPGVFGTSAAPAAHGLVAALHAAGWIIVRDDAIRLAQAHARQEARDEAEEAAAPKRPKLREAA